MVGENINYAENFDHVAAGFPEKIFSDLDLGFADNFKILSDADNTFFIHKTCPFHKVRLDTNRFWLLALLRRILESIKKNADVVKVFWSDFFEKEIIIAKYKNKRINIIKETLRTALELSCEELKDIFNASFNYYEVKEHRINLNYVTWKIRHDYRNILYNFPFSKPGSATDIWWNIDRNYKILPEDDHFANMEGDEIFKGFINYCGPVEISKILNLRLNILSQLEEEEYLKYKIITELKQLLENDTIEEFEKKTRGLKNYFEKYFNKGLPMFLYNNSEEQNKNEDNCLQDVLSLVKHYGCEKYQWNCFPTRQRRRGVCVWSWQQEIEATESKYEIMGRGLFAKFKKNNLKGDVYSWKIKKRIFPSNEEKTVYVTNSTYLLDSDLSSSRAFLLIDLYPDDDVLRKIEITNSQYFDCCDLLYRARWKMDEWEFFDINRYLTFDEDNTNKEEKIRQLREKKAKDFKDLANNFTYQEYLLEEEAEKEEEIIKNEKKKEKEVIKIKDEEKNYSIKIDENEQMEDEYFEKNLEYLTLLEDYWESKIKRENSLNSLIYAEKLNENNPREIIKIRKEKEKIEEEIKILEKCIEELELSDIEELDISREVIEEAIMK